MESLLFNYLKEKATDKVTMNNIAFINQTKKYTFYDLYQEVLKKREKYNNEQLWTNTPYIIVMNDIRSIATIIALLSLGYSPILINGRSLLPNENASTQETIEELKYCITNHIINEYSHLHFDRNKLKELINKNKKSTVVGNPSFGNIGICTSGSIDIPKTVFTDEKLLIRKVFESKYNNRYRKIYNSAPLSSISGLFTNLFIPIVSNSSEAILTDKFDMLEARFTTDVYLPRNFLDIVTPYQIEAEISIEKIFFYGEQNSRAIMKSIKNSIQLPDNAFVNVYGTTECGGLVCEIEVDHLKDLYVYDYNIENDTIVYSFNNSILYKKVKDKIYKLDKDTTEKYLSGDKTKYLPCGYINDNIKIDKNNCIGECVVDNNIHTGDIITFIGNKLYVIGRKTEIDKNKYLANYDSEISSLIKKNCTTFLDDHNNLCLAIKYDLKDPEGYNDNQITYFRKLTTEYKKIITIIKQKYPIIKEILFFPDYRYKLSEGIKKSNRKQFLSLIDEGRQTNYKLDHYDEVLKETIDNTCLKKLGYIPNYSVNKGKSIIMEKNSITEEQLVDLINDLSIKLIVYTNNGNYYITYDDKYFFGDNNPILDDKALNTLRKYAKYGLLSETLAVINNNYSVKDGVFHYLSGPHHWELKTLDFMVGKTDDNKTIIIPYFCVETKRDVRRITNIDQKKVSFIHLTNGNEQKVNELINEYYPNINFLKFQMIVPLPDSHVRDFSYFGKSIILDNGNINIIDNKYHNKDIADYYYYIIAKAYLCFTNDKSFFDQYSRRIK